MVGERVTVKLNDVLVVDDVVMENYWQRERPLDGRGQIELQTHGGEIRFRNLFVREIPNAEADAMLADGDEAFVSLFNGADFEGWIGAVNGYEIVDGTIRCKKSSGGNLLTEQEYSDFVLRFYFLLPPGGNNGLGIRTPPQGDAAYAGMELQILDNTAEKFATLKPWQYHGSAYGIQAAARGYQRPVGEWNYQEVRCEGDKVQVTLNGTCILDLDLAQLDGPIDGRDHPGMRRTQGHLGFCGHGDPVAFKTIRLRSLATKE